METKITQAQYLKNIGKEIHEQLGRYKEYYIT